MSFIQIRSALWQASCWFNSLRVKSHINKCLYCCCCSRLPDQLKKTNAHRTHRSHQRIYYLKWVLFFRILCKQNQTVTTARRKRKTSSKDRDLSLRCTQVSSHLTAFKSNAFSNINRRTSNRSNSYGSIQIFNPIVFFLCPLVSRTHKKMLTQNVQFFRCSPNNACCPVLAFYAGISDALDECIYLQCMCVLRS